MGVTARGRVGPPMQPEMPVGGIEMWVMGLGDALLMKQEDRTMHTKKIHGEIGDG